MEVGRVWTGVGESSSPGARDRMARLLNEFSTEEGRLWDEERLRFPSGLLPMVGEHFALARVPVTQFRSYRDTPDGEVLQRLLRPRPDHPGKEERRYQEGAVRAGITGRRGIVQVPTGGGKSEIAIRTLDCLDLPSLFLVPSIPIATQITEKAAAYGMDVGRFFGPHRETGTIVVADWRLLARRLARREPYVLGLLSRQVVVVDECQGASSASLISVLMRMEEAEWRIGYSASPFEKRGSTSLRDMLLVGMLGPVLFSVSSAELRGGGYISTPTIYMVPVTRPPLHHHVVQRHWSRVTKGRILRRVTQEGIVENDHRNLLALTAAKVLVSRYGSVLLLVKFLEHGFKILEGLTERGIPSAFLMGGDQAVRCTEEGEQVAEEGHRAVLGEFLRGDLKALVASPVLGVGFDLPGESVGAGILLTGDKGMRPVLQRLGRFLRARPGDNRVVVVDFFDTGHFWLANHSRARRAEYLEEGYRVLDKIADFRQLLTGEVG